MNVRLGKSGSCRACFRELLSVLCFGGWIGGLILSAPDPWHILLLPL